MRGGSGVMRVKQANPSKNWGWNKRKGFFCTLEHITLSWRTTTARGLLQTNCLHISMQTCPFNIPHHNNAPNLRFSIWGLASITDSFPAQTHHALKFEPLRWMMRPSPNSFVFWVYMDKEGGFHNIILHSHNDLNLFIFQLTTIEE
jgi:hypothetical protein